MLAAERRIFDGMSDEADERPPAIGARLAAVGYDAGVLVLLLLAGLVAALAYLLVRTSWGRFDVGAGDALVAWALLGATLPAWGTWEAARLCTGGATLGQARFGLAVEGEPSWRRCVRLLVHPLSLPLWGWLALTLLLTEVLWLLVPPLLVMLAIAAAGLASLAIVLLRPSARPLHDRVAGTRLMRRP